RRRCRHIRFRCVDFRRFLGHATCQPRRGCTLAADRLLLNASQRVSHNIMDAAAPRSGKVRSCQKARLCARQESSRRNMMIVRNLPAITAITCLLAGTAAAQEALVTYKSLSHEL